MVPAPVFICLLFSALFFFCLHFSSLTLLNCALHVIMLSYCSFSLSLSPGDNYTEFKGLSPEDAKAKLAQLIKDEVDLNKDGFLTEDEIRQRFHVTTKEYRKKEVLETMKQHDEGKHFVRQCTQVLLSTVKTKTNFQDFAS